MNFSLERDDEMKVEELLKAIETKMWDISNEELTVKMLDFDGSYEFKLEDGKVLVTVEKVDYK